MEQETGLATGGKPFEEAVKEKIGLLKQFIEVQKVESQADVEKASDTISNVKKLLKIVEVEKEKFTGPAKAIIAEAKAKYDPWLDFLEEAEKVIKKRAKDYLDAEDAKAEAARKKIADDLEAGKIKKPETAIRKMEAVAEVPKTVEGTSGGSSLQRKKVPKAYIVNPDIVPDEFWSLDEPKVRKFALAAHKAGQPIPAGVEIRMESEMSSFGSK